MKSASANVTFDSLVQFWGMRPGRFELTRQTAKVAKLGEGWSVLEVGCGDGMSALFLSQQYACDVIGIDASDKMIALANQRARTEALSHRVQFLVADAMQLPFPDYTFDTVMCEAVFSGLADKERAAKEFHRVLRRGGKVVVTDFVLRREIPQKLQCQMTFLPCAGAKRLEEYVSLFEKTGFQDPYIEDHPEEMKRIGYWIAVNYGSVAKFFAKVAAGMHCLGKDGRDGAIPVEAYQEFFSQTTFGYALIALTKP
ncbi:MAG: methyltransferase domain-containing protein [Chloroflexi bacterium]|nr:methyltransferase domain-containing protein [Chloroflexota bacterium]